MLQKIFILYRIHLVYLVLTGGKSQGSSPSRKSLYISCITYFLFMNLTLGHIHSCLVSMLVALIMTSVLPVCSPRASGETIMDSNFIFLSSSWLIALASSTAGMISNMSSCSKASSTNQTFTGWTSLSLQHSEVFWKWIILLINSSHFVMNKFELNYCIK